MGRQGKKARIHLNFPILFFILLLFIRQPISGAPGIAPTTCTNIPPCIRQDSACIPDPNQSLSPFGCVPPTPPSPSAGQPNYIKTRRFADPLTWSTSPALMYSAQPNGADSATINPAALNPGMSMSLYFQKHQKKSRNILRFIVILGSTRAHLAMQVQAPIPSLLPGAPCLRASGARVALQSCEGETRPWTSERVS